MAVFIYLKGGIGFELEVSNVSWMMGRFAGRLYTEGGDEFIDTT